MELDGISVGRWVESKHQSQKMRVNSGGISIDWNPYLCLNMLQEICFN